MPGGAIATGWRTSSLPVRELAARIGELAQQATAARSGRRASTTRRLRRVLAHLQSRTGHDFARYKRATVLRRVARRMQCQDRRGSTEYTRYLHEHVEEAKALFGDLLISVTSFFRDAEAWEALAEQAIPRLFDAGARRPDPGLGARLRHRRGGVHASRCCSWRRRAPRHRGRDPDLRLRPRRGALATAREGRYPRAIDADVSEERLRRFFRDEGDHYRVTRRCATRDLRHAQPAARPAVLAARPRLLPQPAHLPRPRRCSSRSSASSATRSARPVSVPGRLGDGRRRRRFAPRPGSSASSRPPR